MNYKLIFYADYKSRSNNNCRLEVWQDTSNNLTPVEILAASSPIQIKYPDIDHKFEVIRSSGVEVNLLSRNNYQLLGMYTARIKEFKIVHKVNGLEVWSGYLNTENYSEPFESTENYDVSFTANDGFKVLERIKYFQTNSLQPIAKDKNIISQWEVLKSCINNIGLPFTEIVVGCATTTPSFTLGESETIFHKTLVNPNNFIDEDGISKNCLEVLEWQLSPYGLFILKYKGVIHILDYVTLLNGTPAKRYDSNFNYVGLTSGGYITDDLQQVGFFENGATLDVINSYNKAKIVYSPYIESKIETEVSESSLAEAKGELDYVDNSGEYSWKELIYNTDGAYTANSTSGVKFPSYIALKKSYGTRNNNTSDTCYLVFKHVDDAGRQIPPISLKLSDINIFEGIKRFVYSPIIANITQSDNYFLNIKVEAYFRNKKFENSTNWNANKLENVIVNIPFSVRIGDRYWNDDTQRWEQGSGICAISYFGENYKAIATDMYITNRNMKNGFTGIVSYDWYDTVRGKNIPLKGVQGALTFFIYDGLKCRNSNSAEYNKEAQQIFYDYRIKSIKFSIVDSNGDEVDSNDVEITGRLLDDFENDFEEIKTYHGTNKGINKDGSDNLKTDNPLALGSLMYYDATNSIRNIKQWTRQGRTSTIEDLLLRSIISNYQFKTISLRVPINLVSNIHGILTYNSQLPGKKFVVGGGSIDTTQEVANLTLIEISNDLDI